MHKRQFFDLRPGESITIGDSRVTVEAKTGSRVRFKVESTLPTAKARADAAPMQRPAVPAPAPGVAFLPRPKPA